MKRIAFAATVIAACVMATAVQAATVSFGTPGVRAAAANETEVPAGAKIVSFSVTTDADILSISRVNITKGGEPATDIYQNALGSNSGPPPAAIVAAFPSAGADSWIDTPGATSILGVDMPGDGSLNSVWGDTSDDGAQTNFKFAQITFTQGSFWRFSGEVVVSGAVGPESFAFDFIPEPTSFGLAGLGLMGLAAFRRRMA